MSLSNYSIQKIKESQYQSKVRAINNQNRKLKQKQSIFIIKIDNSRNLNKVSIGNGESPLHNYAKFIVSMALKQSNIDFITEYRLSNGKEVDIYDLNNNNFIEIQNGNNSSQLKKLSNYQNELDLGLVNDIFILPLNDFTGNLKVDLSYVVFKLGL